MKRNLVKIVTLCMAVALCVSAMLCFSLTASAATTTLYDADVDATVVVKNNGGFLRVADADNAIKNDIATNGAATYYTIEVTATANVENYVYPILFNESPYNEAWPSKNYESNYKTSTTGSFVLFGSIELGSNKATNIWFYLEDTATEVTLTVSHVKVTVTRDADPETSEASEASEASDVEVSETSETSDVEISDVETSEASDVEASDVEASEVSETSETSETSEPAEFKHGDATGDNEIDMKDVLAIRKFIAGMESNINEAAADAYRDGVIDMKDVLVIRKFIANMIDELPVYPEATSEEPSEAASEEPSEIASEEPSEEPSEAASEEPSEAVSEVSEDLK